MPPRCLIGLNTASYSSCSVVSRQVSPPIIRVLLLFYNGTFVRIALCDIVSDYFQAVMALSRLSPVPFCLYFDGLLVALSKAGVGCFIGDYFVGASCTPMTSFS